LIYHHPEESAIKQSYRPSDFGGISCKEAELPALKIETSGSQTLFSLSLIRRESYMQHSD
jgi:hypothetical protein